MPQIKIHHQDSTVVREYDKGFTLLSILLGNEKNIAAPCGGNGTCGKCRVDVKNIGSVTSCTYYPETNLEVTLPRIRETSVLTAQHDFSIHLPFAPGDAATMVTKPHGLAVDIGTTSIAVYLIDLVSGETRGNHGIANSQGKYGADVISRINYSAQKNGLKQLQKAVVDDIMNAVSVLCLSFELNPKNIVKMSVSANTTMLHLLLAVDPMSIALAPFKPAFIDEKWVLASDIGFFNIHPEFKVHILPSISAYVGADIVSGIASLKPDDSIKNYLFIDVGTNGEMAIVTPDKIWSTATAAGPALEGANISCGMGAYSGAISGFSAKGLTCINNEKPIGICGSGLIDVVAHMLDNEVIGMDGLLADNFVLASPEESGNNKELVITPQDIREVQLAKSAIFTGIQALLSLSEMEYNDVDALFLAGGLGNYLNLENAVRIGLLPQEMINKTIQVGNTSGMGAIQDVCSTEFIKILNQVVAKSEHLDLSTDPNFEMNYAMNMFFM